MTTQRIIGTVGAPGCGKSTYTNKLFYSEPGKWAIIEKDQWREALCGGRQSFWDVMYSGNGAMTDYVMHQVHTAAYRAALKRGMSVILSECHTEPHTFADEESFAKLFGLEIEWKVFLVPMRVLVARNLSRPHDHRVPGHVIDRFYDQLNAPDAWWRTAKNVEVFES